MNQDPSPTEKIPSLVDLEAVSSELDEIDRTLAELDGDTSESD